jgi:hypothetical protein
MPWRVLAAKPGPFQVALDRTDAAEGHSSFHGAYRFQMRLRVRAKAEASRVGLADLGYVAYFENGIMSLPQIFAGDNTIRLKVEDSSQVRSDIHVTYCWQTEDGQGTSHEKRIYPSLFFRDNEAVYRISAPNLRRCTSLVISYP